MQCRRDRRSLLFMIVGDLDTALIKVGFCVAQRLSWLAIFRYRELLSQAAREYRLWTDACVGRWNNKRVVLDIATPLTDSGSGQPSWCLSG